MNQMVICIGLHKTGTSSLTYALQKLGFKVKESKPRLIFSIEEKKYSNILKELEGYDAVEDVPWFMIYKELDRLIPNAKFILTTRDKESWYKSIQRHIGILRSYHHEWIYGRGKAIPKYHKKYYLDFFERHIRNVKTYFEGRQDDLLVLDINDKDKEAKLSNFLGKQEMEDALTFPHLNKHWEEDNPGLIKMIALKLKFYRKKIKHYAIIQYMIWKGYL